jgi:sulfur-oxidizing protein SoxA
MIKGLHRTAAMAILGASVLGFAAVIGTMSDAPAQAKKDVPLVLDGPASQTPWKRYNGWPARDMSKFNTLANLASPPAPKEPRKLSALITGDAANGQKLVADRNRGGSCLACHVMGPAGNADLPGNVGPDLSEIGNAGREDEWLFNYVNDGRVYNPETVMPPWGTHGLFNDQEIFDIVAFLKTLKSPAQYRSQVDDPNKRPAPVETRDNLDDLLNPGMWNVERAQALWKTNGPNGSSCASCHVDAQVFKKWTASMPKWEPRLDKVLGVEEFVFRHAKATTGENWLMQSDQNLALSIYLHFLANGEAINVDVTSPGAKEAFERGKALTERKLGQLNFSCLDCHSPERGGLKWIRGQWLGEQKGQYDHFPTWRTSLQAVWDIRKRFQWCQVNIRADELPPDAKEYGDLELYLASVNSGLKLSVPGIRH